MADVQKIDDETREFIRFQLQCFDKTENEIHTARKPYDEALHQIELARESFMEHHDFAVAFNCVGCSEPVLEGELGYHYEDESACAECAPTWGELEEMAKEGSFTDDVQKKAFLNGLNEYIADGGSRTEKCLVTV